MLSDDKGSQRYAITKDLQEYLLRRERSSGSDGAKEKVLRVTKSKCRH